MDLGIENKLFVVIGASSGLGKGVATALLKDGAKIIAVARNKEKLEESATGYESSVEVFQGDITQPETIQKLCDSIGERRIEGLLLNSGGPPAKAFIETELSDWDEAYRSLVRWKIDLTQKLLPKFLKQNYGRILYIESSAVKQPVRNLVLSNSMRLAVVGFVKTLSQEVGKNGITLNVLAPGFHETPAVERLYIKRSQIENITIAEAKQKYMAETKVGRIGNPDEFGALGAWLLSPIIRLYYGSNYQCRWRINCRNDGLVCFYTY